MHGRGNADHNDESNPSGHVRDDDESSKSEAGAGNDMPGDGRTSDARPDTRLSNASLMTSLGHNAPTMRSRVTVVCAECKKQKLRCDRRIPCESCVKRNTVARCVYTPAAIEKVDITSLNNRLRVVEGSLNALGVPTQGHPHSFPTFPSLPQLNIQHSGTIPYFNASTPGFSPTAAQPVALSMKPSQQDARSSELANASGLNTPPPRMLASTSDSRYASAVAPLDGVTALWMHEIVGEGLVSPAGAPVVNQSSRDVANYLQSTSASTGMGCDGLLKVDLRPIDRGCFGPTPGLGCGTNQDLDARQLLSLHAGLGMPSSSSTSMSSGETMQRMEAVHRTDRSRRSTDSLSDIYAPLAAQLLAQFPSQRRRREMLLRLGTAFLVEGISCVPFGAFCEGIESMFGRVSLEHMERPEGSDHSSLPAFSAIAEAAAGLAVGALIWSSESIIGGKSHDEALRRIIRRTIEPFQASAAGHSSSPSGESTRDDEFEPPTAEDAFALHRLSHLALSMHTARHGYAALDIALVHARILSVHYLLVAQSLGAGLSDALLPPEVPPLVGALTWEARGMGLGIDPDEFDPVGEMGHGSATDTTDRGSSLGTPVKREDGGKTSDWQPQGKGMSLFVKEVRRRMWWWIVFLDFLVSDAFGYNSVIVPGEYTTRLPANVDDTCFRPDSVTLPPPDDNSLEKNIAPLITKFRLLAIAKHAPARMFRIGLIPRATDNADNLAATTAQNLADNTMQWLDELPERFKLDTSNVDFSTAGFSHPPMTSLRPSSEMEEERNAAKALLTYQQCDMAFQGYHFLVRLFTPRLSSSVFPNSNRHTNVPTSSEKVMSADRQLAGLKVIQPALAIIHAAEVQLANAPDVSRAIYHTYLLPRRLFDAAVVLAYTAIQQPLYTSPVVLEAVRTARDILSRVLRVNAGGGDLSESYETEAERIVDLLLKRAEKAKTQCAPIMAGVKRKHEEIEAEADQIDTPFRFPFLGTGIVNVYKAQAPISVSRRGSIDPSISQDSVAAPKFQPYTSTSTRASSSSQKDDARSRMSANTISEHRERSMPTISIRQRVRDNRSKLDISRTGLSPADSGYHSPSSLMLPPQPVSHAIQRTFSSSTPVSPAPSTFASEAMSASPIFPETHYDVNQGMRTQARTMGSSFLGADGGSASSMPFHYPRPLSVVHQYPTPALSGPTYGTPLHLTHGHNRNLPLSTGSPITAPEGAQYNLGSPHPSVSASRVQDGEKMDTVHSWPSAGFAGQGQGDANLPRPMETYPPSQHAQQSQSSAWTGSDNINSAALSQPWNMALFTNWNHDTQ